MIAPENPKEVNMQWCVLKKFLEIYSLFLELKHTEGLVDMSVPVCVIKQRTT